MKKSLFAIVLSIVSMTVANAKLEEFGLFNHLGLGVEVGTAGIGVNVATPLSNHFQLRAGYNFMPSIKVKNKTADISNSRNQWNDIKAQVKILTEAGINDQRINEFYNKYMSSDCPDEVKIDGKLNMNNFKMLVDYFPSAKSSFHLTAGFYLGTSNIIEAYTTNCQDQLQALTYYNKNLAGQTIGNGSNSYTFKDKIGAKLGEYLIEPNGDQARAKVKVNAFKPYLGIGFGRAVPKTRVSFAMDLGVQFWGKPKIYSEQPDGDLQLGKTGEKSSDDVIKVVEKFVVYPCLTFRINGLIF